MCIFAYFTDLFLLFAKISIDNHSQIYTGVNEHHFCSDGTITEPLVRATGLSPKQRIWKEGSKGRQIQTILPKAPREGNGPFRRE